MQSKNIHDNPGPVSFFFLDYINPLQTVRGEAGRGGQAGRGVRPRSLSINKVLLILYIFIYFWKKPTNTSQLVPSHLLFGSSIFRLIPPVFVWLLNVLFGPSICVWLFTLKNEATYVPGMLTVTKRSLIFFIPYVTKMITFTAWLENIY